MVRFFGIFLSLPFKPLVIELSSGMVRLALHGFQGLSSFFPSSLWLEPSWGGY
jgi:hypothetical protein